MADLGVAQTPRGLGDTEPALIKRSPYQPIRHTLASTGSRARLAGPPVVQPSARGPALEQAEHRVAAGDGVVESLLG